MVGVKEVILGLKKRGEMSAGEARVVGGGEGRGVDGGKGREGGLVPVTGIIAGPRHGHAQNSRKHDSARTLLFVKRGSSCAREGASRVWVRVLVGWMGWRGWRGEGSWDFCGLEGK